MSPRRFARLALEDGRRVFAELAEGEARLLSSAPWEGGALTGERPPSSTCRKMPPEKHSTPVTPRSGLVALDFLRMALSTS